MAALNEAVAAAQFAGFDVSLDISPFKADPPETVRMRISYRVVEIGARKTTDATRAQQ